MEFQKVFTHFEKNKKTFKWENQYINLSYCKLISHMKSYSSNYYK